MRYLAGLLLMTLSACAPQGDSVIGRVPAPGGALVDRGALFAQVQRSGIGFEVLRDATTPGLFEVRGSYDPKKGHDGGEVDRQIRLRGFEAARREGYDLVTYQAPTTATLERVVGWGSRSTVVAQYPGISRKIQGYKSGASHPAEARPIAAEIAAVSAQTADGPLQRKPLGFQVLKNPTTRGLYDVRGSYDPNGSEDRNQVDVEIRLRGAQAVQRDGYDLVTYGAQTTTKLQEILFFSSGRTEGYGYPGIARSVQGYKSDSPHPAEARPVAAEIASLTALRGRHPVDAPPVPVPEAAPVPAPAVAARIPATVGPSARTSGSMPAAGLWECGIKNRRGYYKLQLEVSDQSIKVTNHDSGLATITSRDPLTFTTVNPRGSRLMNIVWDVNNTMVVSGPSPTDPSTTFHDEGACTKV